MDEVTQIETAVGVEVAKEVVAPVAEAVANKVEDKIQEAVPSAAQAFRNLQGLLVGGIFPGSIAPQVVKSYQFLEALAKRIEALPAEEAKEVQSFTQDVYESSKSKAS